MSTAYDLLGIQGLGRGYCDGLLRRAGELKQERAAGTKPVSPSENRSVALLFEKPSLRTRMGFEVAIYELGGHSVHLDRAAVGVGKREALKDVAKNLERWCTAIVARLFWHEDLLQLAELANCAVINALTEHEHPCQALADMLTIREAFGEEPVKIVYVGDGNNVARSLALICALFDYPVTICGPDNFRLEPIDGVEQTADIRAALKGAKAVYTDVWVSMGDEREQEQRLKVFDGYQINAEAMALADDDAIFMHCLPARRGVEVTDEVMDSTASVVHDQAENRLHVQKAVMEKVFRII